MMAIFPRGSHRNGCEHIQPSPIVSGRSSRFAAMQMDLGNLVSMLLPPLPLLWFGGSMLIYALHRHHPNPGWGVTPRCGLPFLRCDGRNHPGRHLFPGRGITSWLIAWGIGLAVIVPWSLWSISESVAKTGPTSFCRTRNAPAEEA